MALIRTLLVLLATSACHAKQYAFAPKSSLATVTTLRGGAGPLDPTATAKAVTLVAGAQGFLAHVAPKQTLAMYGNQEPDAGIAQYLMSHVGFGLLTYCVVLYCMLFREASVYSATRLSYVMWVYHQSRLLLGGEFKEGGGTNPLPMWFSTAVFCLCVYGLGQEDYADMLVKATGALWTLSGAQMVLAPGAARKSWGFSSQLNEADRFQVKMFGYFLIAFSVMACSMVMLDATPAQAMGYGALVWGAEHAIGILDGSTKKASVSVEGSVFWLLVNIVVAATTLIESPVKPEATASV